MASTVITDDRQIGDTQTVLASTLKRPDGSVQDLTGLDVKFAMYARDGTAKVAETEDNVTRVDVTGGKVQYQFQDADVDTEGVFYAYFITESASGKQDTYPVDKGTFRINLMKTYWTGN